MSEAIGLKQPVQMPLGRLHPLASLVRGNFTLVWAASTIYGLIFLARLGFPRVIVDTPTMQVHIPFATLFFVCCAWNLFHTPGHGPLFRRVHKVLGWTAMVCGFFSVLTGYIYFLQGSSSLSLPIQVLMMTVGFIQLSLQALGIYYIRVNKWAHLHMSMMTYLFYTSGVLISINWIPKMVTGSLLEGSMQTNWTFVAMMSALWLGRWSIEHAKKHMDLRNAQQLVDTGHTGGIGAMAMHIGDSVVETGGSHGHDMGPPHPSKNEAHH